MSNTKNNKSGLGRSALNLRKSKNAFLVLTLLLMLATGLQASLSDGLVAYYPFNGNANDDSGNGNDGTVYGATLTADRFGNPSSAYSFDGVDDYIYVSDSDSLDVTTMGTLAAWVMIPVGAEYEHRGVIAKMVESTNQVSYELWLETHTGPSGIPGPGIRGLALGPPPTSAWTQRDIIDGRWHHLAFTWNGPEGIIYVDGQDATEGTEVGAAGAMVSDFDLYMGRYYYTPHGKWYSLEGSIDEVRIYNRALSQAEVMELAGIPEPAEGWIAFVSAGDIWAVRTDGTGLKQLTNLPGSEYTPQWSADSSKIVYQLTPAQIWVHDWFTGANTKIYDGDDYGQYCIVRPALSPDGSKILFTEQKTYNNPHITVINADGTERKEVPVEPGFVGHTSWSPTGTAFVYERRNSFGGTATNDLWIYDFTQTGDIMNGINHRLTAGATGLSTTKVNPDWTPSRQIVFCWGRNLAVIDPGQSPNWTGPVSNPLDPDVTFLYEGHYANPSWSPDASQIVTDLYDPESHMWIVDAFPGGNRYQLAGIVGNQPDWGNPVPEPAEPNIAVSPLSHDFGDVELGTSSTLVVTISNVGDGNLNVSGIALETDFVITSAPAASIVVEPDTTVDVEITYTPTVLGDNSAVLKITSDDPDEPVVEVQLSAAGVEVPPPPSEQIANILAFFDTSVGDGSLVGDGPGSSAEKRLNALRNMVEAAGSLIDDELSEEACQQLLDVYRRMDGQPSPPDFVKGEAVPELAAMIQELMTTLGCE